MKEIDNIDEELRRLRSQQAFLARRIANLVQIRSVLVAHNQERNRIREFTKR